MDDIDLLIDLHQDGRRQGPGGEDETRRAIALAGLSHKKVKRIADIGCGTGASTLVLARALDASITAVDIFPAFLDRLRNTAENEGLSERVETVNASMEALPFESASYDVIWSEGAIYNLGFETGVRSWRQFLKPGGVLAVSDLTWLTAQRPLDLDRHWRREYPAVGTASERMAILEANAFSPIGYFPLPERCWLENYYRPMQARFADFLSRHGNSDAAHAIVTSEEKEIALYERYSTYFGYGFFIAERIDD